MGGDGSARSCVGKHTNTAALQDTAFVTGKKWREMCFLLLEYVQQLASPTARLTLLSCTADKRSLDDLCVQPQTFGHKLVVFHFCA